MQLSAYINQRYAGEQGVVARERPGQEDQRAAAGRGRVLVVPSETVPMEGSGRNDMAQEHVIEGFLCIVAFVF